MQDIKEKKKATKERFVLIWNCTELKHGRFVNVARIRINVYWGRPVSSRNRILKDFRC